MMPHRLSVCLLLVFVWGPLSGVLTPVAGQTAAGTEPGQPALHVGARVTEISVDRATDRVRVVIRLDRKVDYKWDRAVSPERLFFDLNPAQLTGELDGKSIAVSQAGVRLVRIAQHDPSTVRVVLHTVGEPGFSGGYIPDPPRIEITIGAATSKFTGSRTTSSSSTVARPAPLPTNTPSEQDALSGSRLRIREADTGRLAKSEPRGVSGSTSANKEFPEGHLKNSPTIANPGSANRPTIAAAQSEFATGTELLKLAQAGNADAQYRLANLYASGTGGSRNFGAAALWYRRAAAQGHAAAESNLGVLYANGWGIARNYREAVRWFVSAAEAGDAGAQNNLGAMFLTGRGVQRNDTKAAFWLSQAAIQDVAEAEYSLATLYANGRGVPHNDAEAVGWLLKSAKQDYVRAQLVLGRMYRAGRGTAQNYVEATSWFRRAAEKGLADAQFELASMYERGWGVPKNDQLAMRWFREAAEKGSVDAQFRLGEFYRTGDSAGPDYTSAYTWYALAASHGSPQAQAQLKAVASRMSATQLAEAQRKTTALEGRLRVSGASDNSSSPLRIGVSK